MHSPSLDLADALERVRIRVVETQSGAVVHQTMLGAAALSGTPELFDADGLEVGRPYVVVFDGPAPSLCRHDRIAGRSVPFQHREGPYEVPIQIGCVDVVLTFSLTTTALDAPCFASPADDAAAQIHEATGVSGGLLVHLGCGDGRLTAALRAGDGYLVHGLDSDAANVARARRHIQSLGSYGPVSVDRFDGTRLPYIDNVVNALVVDQAASVSIEEITRVLAPEGVALIREEGKRRTIVKPRPDELDAWPHFLHAADGNAVADDTVVDVPYHLQWTGGPRYARTHEGVSTVNVAVSDGKRLYYIADRAAVALPHQLPTLWSLVARDAFSGVVLWERPLGRWQARSDGSRHRFPPDLFRRLVAGQRHLYATLDILGPVAALDPATGETIQVYEATQGAEEILHHQGVLYLVVNPAPPETIHRGLLADTWSLTEPKRLMAVDAQSGRILWQKTDRDTLGLAPMSTAVSGDKLVFQNPRHVVCLDVAGGETQWRAERRSPDSRPAWGTPTLVLARDVVLSADRVAPKADGRTPDLSRRTGSELIAYDLHSGRRLWSTPCEESSHVPNELFVVDGLVWAGEESGRGQQDYRLGRDLHTGEVRRTMPLSDNWVSHHHHRCYRDKATSRFILAGRTGVEFLDVASGQLSPHHWIRGICKFGVLPCNGLLYIPPNQCSCYQESLLNGFNALAPRRSQPKQDAQRLHQGPAYNSKLSTPNSRLSTLDSGLSTDWPTYRADAARTGSTGQSLPDRLETAWRTNISAPLTPPVVAANRVYVAAIDRHTVHALDAASGKTLWAFTAGARIDSPRHVAVTAPPDSSVASTTARSADDSTTSARSSTGSVLGVGRRSLTWNSAVTVHGGASSSAARIRYQAAVQLLWQSSRAPQIPPFSIPSKASWCFSAIQWHTTASPSGKLLMRRPWSLAGPQPKQRPRGE